MVVGALCKVWMLFNSQQNWCWLASAVFCLDPYYLPPLSAEFGTGTIQGPSPDPDQGRAKRQDKVCPRSCSAYLVMPPCWAPESLGKGFGGGRVRQVAH